MDLINHIINVDLVDLLIVIQLNHLDSLSLIYDKKLIIVTIIESNIVGLSE